MVKWVVVELSDREYQVLKNIDELEGEVSQKLRELLRNYLISTPRFKVDYHIIHLEEKRELLMSVLEEIWKEYESCLSPLEKWDQEKAQTVRENLMEINAIRPVGSFDIALTGLLKKPWLSAYNSVSEVFDDVDEFSQACIATIYVLDFLSRGTLEPGLLKDATIFLNELYLFSYAVAKKKAHEFQKARGLRCESLPLAGDELVA
ncbi:MAG: hypothetical protein SCH39_12960 [Methanosarcinales archaeon]|nr:hypothetical protein [ANME-2 cluster archaeon]MDF1531504.1 hypothetical protein [ANME-2 cluster archaeon]MDW7777228.1 hypothetical protein [Methanosarcinales archaeon]